jgi:hypothetical protein
VHRADGPMRGAGYPCSAHRAEAADAHQVRAGWSCQFAVERRVGCPSESPVPVFFATLTLYPGQDALLWAVTPTGDLSESAIDQGCGRVRKW